MAVTLLHLFLSLTMKYFEYDIKKIKTEAENKKWQYQ